jgi:hypothetical protein
MTGNIEQVELREQALIALGQMKKLEQHFELTTKTYKRGVVVSCKNKERIKEYDKLYK